MPQPPESSGGYLELLPHPYALGPTWAGGNCWRADFGDEVTGIVDHDWCERIADLQLAARTVQPQNET
ncbi:MAG: hypothetical protein ACXV5U_09150 [Ilumatobacteraceae bacterium]